MESEGPELSLRAIVMLEALPLLTFVLVAAALVLIVILLRNRPDFSPFDVRLTIVKENQDRLERGLRDEIARNREESAGEGRALRQEVARSITALGDSIARQAAEMNAGQRSLREEVSKSLTAVGDSVSQDLTEMHAAERALREEMGTSLSASLRLVSDSVAQQISEMNQNQRALREEISASLAREAAEVATAHRALREEIAASLLRQAAEMNTVQRSLREEVSNSLKAVGDSLVLQMSETTATQAAQISNLSASVDARLKSLQEENSVKLDQMRQTVDEKLQGTLEKRLGESFRLVSDRLEQVYRGLGEMQTLATGVGDLKKVLSNVKTRGTWGEVQLGNLLEQVLTPDQYAQNVATTGTKERVEFAIRLPGRDDSESVVWLPVDAKFPQEDYQRLMEASEQADAEAVEIAVRQLELRVKACARDISQKYLQPPQTTDFGILYLPTEGLYAEVLRRPGMADALQREFRVVVAGPMTLTALLNSLQMGFRTLAIQQRSSEVWKVLGAVKTEFQRYGEVLEKVQKKLEEASKTVETAAVRTRAIRRKLRDVEALPEAAGQAVLTAGDADEELEQLVES